MSMRACGERGAIQGWMGPGELETGAMARSTARSMATTSSTASSIGSASLMMSWVCSRVSASWSLGQASMTWFPSTAEGLEVPSWVGASLLYSVARVATPLSPIFSRLFTLLRRASLDWSAFHLIVRGAAAAAAACLCVSNADSGETSATGMEQPFSFPLCATPLENRIRPEPEHSIPFFWHLIQAGSVLSQTIRRLEHWKQPDQQGGR
jgi:hypothetical protein